MFYSKSTGGFYSTEIHGNNMPDDVVEITNEHYTHLLNSQSNGFSIGADEDGNPIATAPPPESQLELIQQAVNKVKFALQSAIDSKAHESGFSAGNAFMLYAGFTNPFKASSLVFAQWEASVWEQAEAYKTQVLAGKAPMLSPQEAVAMMPAYPS